MMAPPRPRFVPLRVAAVVDETADARSFVLEVPADEQAAFAYEAGQYCTFKVDVEGTSHLRCYSMSSSPDVDDVFRTTVKRVPDGVVSNWLNDRVQVGDELWATPPAGVFRLDPGDDRPVVAFAGGSGITPVASIVKTALATTDRPVRLLYANRDTDSIILGAELDQLLDRHGDRFTLVHHLDADSGFLDADGVGRFLGPDLDVAVYLCGPTPFMDLVETTLADLGHDTDSLWTERFVDPPALEPDQTDQTAGIGDTSTAATAAGGTLVLTLNGARHALEHNGAETVLEAARRGGLAPPFSCQAGNCATCIAELTAGSVHMRVNDVLTDDELEEGWILTCQSLPTSADLTVVYPD